MTFGSSFGVEFGVSRDSVSVPIESTVVAVVPLLHRGDDAAKNPVKFFRLFVIH